MGVPIRRTVGPLVAASANNISLSQTPAAAFLLNGTTAGVLDAARQVLITTGGSEAGKTATIIGLGPTGLKLQEVVTLPSSATTVASALSYKSVTSITVSAALGAAATVGTNGLATSDPINMNDFGLGPVSIQVDVSGTINYTVQSTNDDLLALAAAGNLGTAIWIDDATLASKSTSLQTTLTAKPAWLRLKVNSQTNPGFATIEVIQAGLAGS